MPLQNFIAKSLPAISAAWLNVVDALKFTVFDDATTKAQARAALSLDAGVFAWQGIDSGAVNAAVVTPIGATTLTLVQGLQVTFKGITANTGAATLNFAGTGVVAIINQFASALTGGELSVSATLEYNGTSWQIVSGSIPPSMARTTLETSQGVMPVNFTRPPGDPRRMHVITVSDEELVGLYCHGFVPTYVDSDTFTVPGDATTLWPERTRIAVFGASGGRQYCQVLTIAFAAGITTVDVRLENANLPLDPVAILKFTSVQLAHLNTFMMDYDGSQVMQITNKNTGPNAATQLFVGNFVDSGVGLIGTFPTTVGSFPGGVFYSLAPTNPIAAVTTGLDIPMCFVTHDRCRLILDGDGLPAQFTCGLVIQQTTENPNGSSTSKLQIDGTATAYLSLEVAGVEQAIMTVNTTMVFGTVTNIPLRFISNGAERASIDGAGNIVAGPAAGAISTSATDGFLYIPSCAGIPTGTPTAKSGMVPMVVDTANNRLYFYSSGAWQNAGP